MQVQRYVGRAYPTWSFSSHHAGQRSSGASIGSVRPLRVASGSLALVVALPLRETSERLLPVPAHARTERAAAVFRGRWGSRLTHRLLGKAVVPSPCDR
jgi:hypothetical protein